MKKRSIVAMTATLALFAGYLAISPALRAKGDLRANSAHASELLTDARNQALKLHADVNLLMVTYTQPNAALDNAAIAMISQHVREAEGLAARLENLAPDAEVWQREVIGQVAPILKEVAGNTHSALRFLDDAETLNHESEFGEYLAESDHFAREAVTHIASELDYGTSKNRFYDAYSRFLNAMMAKLG